MPHVSNTEGVIIVLFGLLVGFASSSYGRWHPDARFAKFFSRMGTLCVGFALIDAVLLALTWRLV